MIFRQGSLNDLDEIFKMKEEALEVYKEYITWNSQYPTREKFKDDIEKGHMFLLEEEGEIIAFAVLNNEEDISYYKIPWTNSSKYLVIHRVLVSHKHSRKGIGRKLIEELCNYAIDKGLEYLRLDVKTTNLPAQKLYNSMGFKALGEIPLEGRIGTWYAMEKKLK